MDNVLTDLVKRARAGDKSAVAELFEQTNAAMYRYAMRFLGEEDAQDALQNSYIKMIQSLGSLREDAAFTGWLRAIVRNECLAVCRTQGREVVFDTQKSAFERIEELDQDFLPADAAENRELSAQVSACIETLPEVQREALLLYYYEDCKIADIAQLTECNENTVKYRLCQARRRLKDQFVRDGLTVSGAASASAMRGIWADLAESQALGQVARERMMTAVLSEAAVQFSAGSAAAAGGGFLARLAGAPLAVKLAAGIGCAVLLAAGSYRAVQNGRPEDFTKSDAQTSQSADADADATDSLSEGEEGETGLDEDSAPAIQLENTGVYRIADGVCQISFEEGDGWKTVPVDLDLLIASADNRYNSDLVEGSYVLNPEKTAFVYGSSLVSFNITYSDDMGETWQTVALTDSVQETDLGYDDAFPVRLRFCSFVSRETGYLILTGNREMSQEWQMIYRTRDGGDTWTYTGSGPRTSLLSSAAFLDASLGFLCYNYVEGAESTLYRTDSAGQYFEPVILEQVEETLENGAVIKPYTTPYRPPYWEDGVLVLLMGQGANGDYQGGRLTARYESRDRGATWAYTGTYLPDDSEPG